MRACNRKIVQTTPFDFFSCFPLEGGNKETRTQEVWQTGKRRRKKGVLVAVAKKIFENEEIEQDMMRM